MAKRRRASDVFDVELSQQARTDLAHELCRDIEDALSVRQPVIGDGGMIDYANWYYEQGKSAPEDRPFPGAADLTSWFITENVDAMRSRIMRILFGVEPFCIVEGWGQSAKRAPIVEEFHQWQIEEEGLQTELAKVAHQCLLEDGGILEVRERIETRKEVTEMDAALEPDPTTGGPIIDAETGRPRYRTDEYGDPVPAEAGQSSVRLELTTKKTKRLGPEYDVISMKDFVFLPGHAKSFKQCWGYAARFWSRLPELHEKVTDGVYDAEAVKVMGEASDRESADVRGTEIAPQYGPAVEKELFSVSLKRDLDGDGREEWYVATLSLRHRALLRLKLDTFVQKVGKPRCVPFVLFPRSNSVYGYSYAFNKLLTLAEEHTSTRNVIADRSGLAANAPMTVVQGCPWDADTEPFGIGRIITVRAHNEIQRMDVGDVPLSVINREQGLIAAKERVGGLSDTAIGVQTQEKRTLGEVEIVAGASAVRIDEILGYFREGIETVMQLRHAIWQDTLQADERGMEAPSSVVSSVGVRGAALADGKFTAEMLKGKYRFKPRGSSETADRNRMRADWNAGLSALTNLAKVAPSVQQRFQDPEVVSSLMEEWARVYNVRDRAPFLKPVPPPMPAPGPAGPGGAGPGGAGPQGLPAGGLPPGVGMPQGGLPPQLAALMNGGVPDGGAGGY